MGTSLAKLCVPLRSALYPRTRLLSLLEEGLSRPVVWVAAPPGSGKTSLVVQYLAQRRLRPLWYSVGGEDDDPATFFYYLGLAARGASRKGGGSFPLLTPEYGPRPDPFVSRFFENVALALGPKAVLVFDNFQEVEESSVTYKAVANGLATLQRGQRVVIVSRSEPAGPWMRLLADGRMSLIRGDEFTLDDEDVAGLMRLRTGASPPTEAVRALQRETGGWTAAVTLSLEWAGSLAPGGAPSSSREAVFRYFAGEVFAALPKEEREILMRCALFPAGYAHLAALLAEPERTLETLKRMSRKNFFVEQKAENRSVYELHPLLHLFLLHEAEKRIPGETLDALRRRVVEILYENGQWEEAAHLCVAHAYWDQLAAILREGADTMVFMGRLQELAAMVAPIPETVLRRHWALLYAKGMSLIMRDPKECVRLLSRACRSAETLGDPIAQRDALIALIEALYIQGKDRRHWYDWTKALERLFAKRPALAKEPAGMRGRLALLRLAVMAPGGLEEAKRWWRQGRYLTAPGVHPRIRSEALFYHGVAFGWMCQYDRMEEHLEQAERLAVENDNQDNLVLMAMGMRQLFYMFTNEQEKCRLTFERFVREASKCGILMWVDQFYGIAAQMAVDDGRLDLAREYLVDMEKVGNMGNPLTLSLWAMVSAGVAYQEEQVEEAQRLLAKALKVMAPVGTYYALMNLHTMVAIVNADLGLAKRAALHIDEAKKMERGMRNPHMRWTIHLAEAYAMRCAEKMSPRYVRTLRSAFAFGRRRSLEPYHFSFLPRPALTQLLQDAMTLGAETATARRLITKLGVTPKSVADGAGEAWPWPLKIRTLGNFAIERHGAPVVFKGKVPKKPLSLLQAVIGFGGRQASVEEIADALWPDADGDAAYTSLTVTLTRLRKALGVEGAVEVAEGRIRLNPQVVWVDVVDHLERNKGNSPTTPPPLFLRGEEETPWTLAMRRRLGQEEGRA